VIIPSGTMTDYYLLSLINSNLLNSLHQIISGEEGRVFAQVRIENLEKLPIYKVNITKTSNDKTAIQQEISGLYTRCLTEGHTCVLEFTAHHLTLTETDVIHDLLAFLAQQMIDLNKQKQAEVKRFLGWLETQLHIKPNKDGDKSLDSLTAKTIIQGYLGDYQKGERATSFEDFYFRLHQNRSRFNVALPSLKANLETEYLKSLETLLPLKGQLASTDALIDKVVYQLYGLTDDEIRLIEYPQFEQAVTQAWEKVAAQTEAKTPEQADSAAEPAPISEEVAAEATATIIQEVVPAVENYLARVPEDPIQAKLHSEIPNWAKLPETVRALLLTNEIMLAHTNLPTYTQITGAYGSVVEVALNEKIFGQFRQKYQANDCDNHVFQEFMNSTKTLSLGSIAVVLPSSRETKLQAFLKTLYPDVAALINNLKNLLTQPNINKFRNEPQHGKLKSLDDAQAARQWALEILGYV
jgi:hypothetical protein